MVGRIVEIASDDRYLSLDRGFLVASHKGVECARTPIDDIGGLICAAHGLTFSANLLVALAGRGCPVVICGSSFRPEAIVWPLEGHHQGSARLSAQIAASLPLRKRLWKQVVQAKIHAQATILRCQGHSPQPLIRMAAAVTSGDRSNLEGQAARHYWKALMGPDFRRDPDLDGPNALLNYGYTVLRATVARHIAAAGLHPNVPLHHLNESNPLRLADDLMEPFRPVVDLKVVRLLASGVDQVTVDAKRVLALIPSELFRSKDGLSTVSGAISNLCISLAEVFQGDRNRLALSPWVIEYEAEG